MSRNQELAADVRGFQEVPGPRAHAQLQMFTLIILVFQVNLENVLQDWPLQVPWIKKNLKLSIYVRKKLPIILSNQQFLSRLCRIKWRLLIYTHKS